MNHQWKAMREPYREPAEHPRPVSPSFLVALINQDARPELLHELAAEISTIQVFESCARREITPEQGAKIMMLAKERPSLAWAMFRGGALAVVVAVVSAITAWVMR